MHDDFPAVRADAELSAAEVQSSVAALLAPAETVPDVRKAAFLRALRVRGETPGEIAAFARALLARAVDPGVDPARLPGPLLDVCGTGGDRLDLFNVSTTSAFVLAAGGVAVAKHGNRGVSSRAGGADVLAALGILLDRGGDPANEARRDLEAHGLCFLFAPRYHPAFAAVAPVRRALAVEGVSTVFNLLGPLLNPARPPRQLVGVFDGALTVTFARVLRELGRTRAWAVHGDAGGPGRGMDELSTLGPTTVVACGAEDDETPQFQITPEDAGLPRANSLEELRGGGDASANARTLVGILAGEIGGARRDLVLLNAAAGFVVAGLSADLSAGVERARQAIGSGAALAKLRALGGRTSAI